MAPKLPFGRERGWLLSENESGQAVQHRCISVCATAIVAIAAIALHLTVPLNHDAAWILEGATALLRGAQFGRDVIDANPPLAWWIACIPAFAAMAGASLAAAWVIFVVILGSIGLVLTDWALAQGSLSRAWRNWLLPLFAVLLFLQPGYDFGQREHLMLITAMPYLAAASAVVERRKLRWSLRFAIGLFCAVGFCLKPYFLLVPLCVETWIALRRRSFVAWWRPEFVLIPIAGVVYLAAVWIFAPAYLAVEVAQSQAIYWAYNVPLKDVLTSLIIVMLAPLGGWTIVLFVEQKAPRSFSQLLVCAAFGAAISAIIQHKGFSYHFVPAIGFLSAGCFAAAFEGFVSERKLVIAAVCTLMFFSAVIPSWRLVEDAGRPGGTTARVRALAVTFKTFAGPEGYVYAFVTSPRDIHPAIVASGTKWSSEACCIYHLPAAIRANERPAEDRPLIRSVASRELNTILNDLASRRPGVIAIDDEAQKLGFVNMAFDYVTSLSRFARFRQLLDHYVERRKIGNFRIFVRKGARAA